MKLCTYHMQGLREHLDKKRLTQDKFFFAAQALVLDNAIQADPQLADSPSSVCPICKLVKPSWLRLAAQSIQEKKDQVR